MTAEKEQHFPQTATWIGRRLALGDEGLEAVRQHVMAVYYQPLMIYFRGCRDRWMGEPEDIVNGFFASYLARADYFEDWQQRGDSLAQWLRNGIHVHVKALKAKAKYDQKKGVQALPEDNILPAGEDKAQRDYELHCVLSLAQAAISLAEEFCAEEGLQKHWEILRRHYLNGQGYTDFADELGVSPERASVMNRTALVRLGRATREVIERELPAGASIEEAAQNLLEVLKQ